MGTVHDAHHACFISLRLPKTPLVRVPRHKERVYSISVNGSPISAGNEDIVINIPSGNGEVSARCDRVPVSKPNCFCVRPVL